MGYRIELLLLAAWALSFPIMDAASTDTSPSFHSPPFTLDAYESDLQTLSAAAKQGEAPSQRSPKQSAGFRKLQRFEVHSDGEEAEDLGSCEELELEDEEEEEEDEATPKKKPAKKHATKKSKKTQKKIKQSESDEADKKGNKRKKDDDDDDDREDSEDEVPILCCLLACRM